MADYLLTKDIWGVISQYVEIQVLLSLRSTSQRMNAIVIGMQARWYRAHQWFLARNHRAKVKCAKRVHVTQISRFCVTYDYAYPGKLPSHTYVQRTAGIQKAIDDGLIQEDQCKQQRHWQTRVPKNELDIPLDKSFKPKKNNYIYYYLIECYRAYSPLHAHKMATLPRTITSYRNEIKRCEAKIANRKAMIIEDEKRYELEKTKYVNNTIFNGYAINHYKMPSGNSTKRAKLG